MLPDPEILWVGKVLSNVAHHSFDLERSSPREGGHLSRPHSQLTARAVSRMSGLLGQVPSSVRLLGHAAGIPSCQGPQGEMGGAWHMWVGPTYPAGAPALRGWLEAMLNCWLLRAHAHLQALQPRMEPLGGTCSHRVRGQNPGSGPSSRRLCPALSYGSTIPKSLSTGPH